MKNLDILQNGAGWSTNIGNAFIDLGSMAIMQKATINANIHLASTLPNWVFSIFRSRNNLFNLQNYAQIDYIVISGAVLSEQWFKLQGDTLSKLNKKGVKLIINGGGMVEGADSEDEIEKTRKCIKEINPYIFVSRDKKTFESFEDLCDLSYDGIDCGFFVNEAYTPLKMDMPEFVTLNFDKSPAENIPNIDKDKLLIRMHHSFWHNFSIYNYIRMLKNYYYIKNTLISDIPSDYLNLYANTSVTYSDRVHACVATISYGKPARLFSNSKRAILFNKIGAHEITEKVVFPNIEKINKEKGKQINFLSNILSK